MKKRADGRFVETMTIDGKRKYFYGLTEREVLRKIKDFTTVKARGSKFIDVASEWKEDHFKTIRNGTKTCYSPAYTRAVEEFGEEYIDTIETKDIYAFIHGIIKKGYSQKTVKTQKLVLNLIFNYAIVSGELDTNPTTAIRLPSNLPKTKREIPADDVIETVRNSVNCHFGLFAYFLVYTGCRRGEALAVRYEDIDFDNNAIRITKAAEWQGNHPSISLPKTEAGNREIILLDALSEKIPKNKTGYLFASADGKLMTSSAFKRHWERYRREAGLNKAAFTVTPHQLRHAYATMLYEAGIDEKMAQELLGHANISVTRDIYTHIRKSKKEATAKQLNEHIKNSNLL
jgi:Site-specific recombinase XerD